MTATKIINSKTAHSFTFGIELETTLPAGVCRANSYIHGIQIPGLPQGWVAKTDCTIQTSRPGYTGVEIVSPKLQGKEGLDQVRQVAAWMEAKGARTNPSCGTHVHVGIDSVVGTDRNQMAAWVGNLINVFAQYEIAVQGASGSKRRTQNYYCQGIKTSDNRYKEAAERINGASKSRKASALPGWGHGRRYHTLNLTNIDNASKKTIEIRAFSGTTDGAKMVAWIQMSLALAERALGRKVRWTAPETRIYRGGDAQKTMDRFFYLMGWTAGRRNDGTGECAALGWIDDVATLSAAKKELRRLAKKFDAA